MKAKRLIRGHAKTAGTQLFRAISTSLMAGLIDYGLLILLKETLVMAFVPAASIGMASGLAFTYIAGRMWIFPPVPAKFMGWEVGLFLAISLAGAGIHTIVLSIGQPLILDGLHYLWVKSLAVSIMFAWNFSLRRITNRIILAIHSEQQHEIVFPRKRYRRTAARALLRLLLPLVFRIHIQGRLPQQGPYILAGNHSGFLEVLLMIGWGPRYLELLGAGDVPMEPRFAFFTGLYGFIPVNRGNVDRRALLSSAEVLRQGGCLGIFPEGGIWEYRESRAQKGVSWLSMSAGVPVVPVSFAGMGGRELFIHFSPPLPPPPKGAGKHELESHAALIMESIRNGIAPEYRRVILRPQEERFELELEIIPENAGSSVAGGSAAVHPEYAGGPALARLLFTPVLLRTFARNLKLKVEALLDQNLQGPSADFALAAEEILNYLQINRNFFVYRFGPEEAARIHAALEELAELCRKHPERSVALRARRIYRMPGQDQESRELLPAEKNAGKTEGEHA